VLSGSDDGNVRIWKAKASEKLGVITARERAAIEYRNSLKERWRVDSEVDKVARSVIFPRVPAHLNNFLMMWLPSTRHLPKSVHQTAKLKNTMLEARRVKDERRRKHSRLGESKPKAERKKVVIVEQT
jgi:WD repeat and SOF domain-containing protein 1